MTIQTVNLGTAPSGAGGDTFRSTGAKINENFTNWDHAASRYVGVDAGNVMEVGAYGLGGNSTLYTGGSNGFEGYHKNKSGFFFSNTSSVKVGPDQLPTYTSYMVSSFDGGGFFAVGCSVISNQVYIINGVPNNNNYPLRIYNLRHSGNTTIDSNGFIKAASPVIKLFSDKIESNDEAQQQNPVFEKVDVGDYLIKGSAGFAKDGWYIETPKDANGNLLVAVVYEQLANGDISVKTYDYMLDKKGRIVADTETPLDIPENRWIDIRLQELPQPESEVTDDPEQ